MKTKKRVKGKGTKMFEKRRQHAAKSKETAEKGNGDKSNAAVQSNSPLPPFYKSIEPLTSKTHNKMRLEPRKNFRFASDATGVVLAADEFPAAERDYPIVFSKGEHIMPIALTGVPGGRNLFVSATTGKWKPGAYIPVYVLRYPFILAKLKPEMQNLTLCFDSASNLLIEGKEGNLFDGEQASGRTKAILQLCEWYEKAILRTENFIKEINELGLFMDAQANVRLAGREPTLFNGFQIVNEQKFKEIPDADLQRLARSGALALIHAHLLSLKNIERLFTQHFSGPVAGKRKAQESAAA